jgi:DNA-directed RNA polymerase subunit RPC12/RpoP
MKICIECKEKYTLEEFHRNRKLKDGRSTRCKYCVNEMHRMRYGDSKRHHKMLECKKCRFHEICKENIWDMYFWPYCMRRT